MFNSVHKILKRMLPAWVYDRLIGDWDLHGLKKYVGNTSWVFFARLFSFAVSFFTIAIVARYLGPENFGKLSYAQSFVAIFSVFASLGIDQVLYRELIAYPEKRDAFLGTAFIAKLVFGLLTLITTVAVAAGINDDPILTWLICIITFSFLFQPFGILAHFFNAQVQAKYVAIATITISLLIPALKLLVIFFNKGILYLASLITLEAVLAGIVYVLAYHTVFKHSLRTWHFSLPILRRLLRDSWPLFAASLAGYIYGRIDQVMIQHFIDSASVGLYDAAVRVTEILSFLPVIIMTSLFPAVMNAQKQHTTEYKKRLWSLTALCLGFSACCAIFVYAAAPLIVHILFGEGFMETASLLRIYVWSNIGTVAILLIQQYLVGENRAKQFLLLSLVGALLNTALNIFLISRFGTAGAAYATLITLTLFILVFVVLQKLHIRRRSRTTYS